MDTAAILLAIATLVAALASAVVSIYNATRLKHVERDVNSNMKRALDEIVDLREKLVVAKRKRVARRKAKP